MHIIYAATTCSDAVYGRLFEHSPQKPSIQAQKYHRLLIEGLGANARVDVVANPPVNRSVLDRPWISLPKEEYGNVVYHNAPAIRNPMVKLEAVALSTFFKTLFLARKDSAVVVDCLNRTTSMFALLAARCRGLRCVGIVTDLPEMMLSGWAAKVVSDFLVAHCTDYVMLTEAMNRRLNPHNKPCVILEGHADIAMKNRENRLEDKAKPRVVLYAGCIARQYGLMELMEGFLLADLPDAQLHLYGVCDADIDLAAITREHPNIRYGGVLLNHQVVEKEMGATLLVNPRPTVEEFVQYSFPSKNMEYMASGTPLLTTRLPGMPKEYYPYVYLLEKESAQGIADALRKILSNSDEALHRKGAAAREFILGTRNNVAQGQKILAMLEQNTK